MEAGVERETEVAARVDAVRAILDRRGESSVLLIARRNFAWLTAGGSSHIVLAAERGVVGLLVERDHVTAITQNIEAARVADEELDGLGIETVPVPWWQPGAIEAEAARRAGGTPLDESAIEADLVDLRSVLSPYDRARMVELGGVAHDAMAAGLADLEPGTTEAALASDLIGRLPGIRVPVVLIAADDRIARFRHPLPTANPIRGRVMAVIVAERQGIHVAMTRFREFEPPSWDVAGRFAAVAEVERAFHSASLPGATLGDAFAAGQAAYARAGFPEEWRDHHQGGTIAYQGRERIAIPGDPTPIRPGMAFAWNPSIAGVKVEDTFILEDDGSRTVVTAG
jgi:Xaa-Pro dipeptidase